MSERACCAEARERLLPQFRFNCTTCGHATNCPEHIRHAMTATTRGAVPLEAMLEERTRQVRDAADAEAMRQISQDLEDRAFGISYEQRRAIDIEASGRMLEMERRRERRDALILGVLVALWVATAVAMVLKTTGVLP